MRSPEPEVVMRNEPHLASSPRSRSPLLPIGIVTAMLAASCESSDRVLSPSRDGLRRSDATVVDGGESSSDRLRGTIAFHSSRDGNFQIYLMNADGTNQRRLLPNNGQQQFD